MDWIETDSLCGISMPAMQVCASRSRNVIVLYFAQVSFCMKVFDLNHNCILWKTRVIAMVNSVCSHTTGMYVCAQPIGKELIPDVKVEVLPW